MRPCVGHVRGGRWFAAGLVVLLVLSAVPAVGQAGADDTQAAPDYNIDSVDELDYYNSRGFADRNGDGRVVVALRGTFNMSRSRDPTLRFDGPEPFVLRGTADAGFRDVPAPLVRRSGEGSLVLRNLSIADVRAEQPATTVVAGGPLTVRNVTLRDTVHRARYASDTFTETHRVAAYRAGGDVRVVDSTVRRADHAVRAGGSLVLQNATIADIDTGANGAVTAVERARVLHSTIVNASGARGGGIAADRVTVRNSTLRTVRAGYSGGAINAESAARVVDSTIRNAEAGRNGGAVAADGTVVLRNATIVDAASDQGYSLYGYGPHSLTVVGSHLENLDPVQFGYGGISDGRVTIRDSRLVNVSRVHAADVDVRGSTAAGRLRLTGRLISVRNSTLRTVRGIDGSEVLITDSRFRRSDRVVGSESITVRGSVFAESAGLAGFAANDGPLEVVNSTFHGTQSPAVPPTDYRTLDRVNFIEATPPVFVGRVPNRTDVFVDTTNDTEQAEEWDADVFWSRDQPFPSIQRLDVGPTPTAPVSPTATPTPEPTVSPSRTATPIPTAAAEGGGAAGDDQSRGNPGRQGAGAAASGAAGDGTGAVPPLATMMGVAALAIVSTTVIMIFFALRS
jgi:hypothetical protein